MPAREPVDGLVDVVVVLPDDDEFEDVDELDAGGVEDLDVDVLEPDELVELFGAAISGK